MDTKLRSQLCLIQMSYNITGNITKIDTGLYGFMQKDRKIILVNLKTMTPLDDSYNIVYYNDNLIVLHKLNTSNFLNSTIIIDRNTFEELYRTSNYIYVEGDVLYEVNSKITTDISDANIFDIKGNKIGNISLGWSPRLKNIACTDYYIYTYTNTFDNEKESLGTYGIMHYIKEDNTIKDVWKSLDYDAEEIAEGKVMFCNTKDYRETYVYDFREMRMISEQ